MYQTLQIFIVALVVSYVAYSVQFAQAANINLTLTPTADSYVQADQPTTNYGTSTQFRTDGSPVVRSFIKFNVSGVSGNVISATLRIYGNSNHSAGFQVFSGDANWSESTLNYNNQPTFSPNSIGTSGSITAGTWKTVNVTNAVSGNGEVSFTLTTTSSTAMSLASRESANDPQLIIQYDDNGTGPTVTPVITVPQTLTPVPPTPTVPGPTVPPSLTPVQPSVTPFISPTPGAGAVISIRVASSSDDAEQRISNGAIDISSSDLELGADGSSVQIVGMRFTNVQVPPGAAINSAYIEFETDETKSGATSVTFKGQAADNAAAFTTATNNISSRITTSSSVPWNNIPAWSIVNGKNQTPNLASIVSEIINRPGWNSGNAMVITISGTGTRTAESYNGEAAAAPLLVIDYGNSGGPTVTPPLVSITPSPTTYLTPTPGGTDPYVMAAGDIICSTMGVQSSSSCRHMPVSQIMVDQQPAGVFAVGDTCHTPSAACYSNQYDSSWGRVKSITRPAVGNHEYSGSTPEAHTYFDYFNGTGNNSGPAGNRGQGYYSYDIGSWHIIVLNTQCSQAGGCGVGSPQYNWLQNDLQTHNNACTLAYWHIPYNSSGGRANTNSKNFWNLLYNNNAEVIINGHDHIYERFAPQKDDRTLDSVRGIRQFTVGTGGSNHTSISSIAPNSLIRNSDTFGVLKVTLHPNSYDWQFVPDTGSGSFTDSGTSACH